MKVRNGFVSNSSTSSFICAVCNEEYTGWDASPSDYGGTYCENEHAICGECYPDIKKKIEEKTENGCEHEFDRKTMKFCPECGAEATIKVELDRYEMSEEYCPICNFETYDEGEMATYLEKTREVTREEVFAQVKEKNRRRRKLYDGEYVSYVLDKFELTDDMLLEEIKERFGKYKEYGKFTRGW